MIRNKKQINGLENPRIHMDPAPTAYPLPSVMADPLGSWTGVPVQPLEQPVQDADDL